MDPQKNIVFTDAVKLRSMIEFARVNNCSDELAKSLLYLLSVVTGSMAAIDFETSTVKPTPGDQTAVISRDFAMFSLGFAIMNGTYAVVEGGKCSFNGGFIYEGPAQPLNGSAPAFTVSLSSDPSKHSWGIHT